MGLIKVKKRDAIRGLRLRWFIVGYRSYRDYTQAKINITGFQNSKFAEFRTEFDIKIFLYLEVGQMSFWICYWWGLRPGAKALDFPTRVLGILCGICCEGCGC